MYLVTGITGQVGAATARALSARNAPIRALVRDRQKASEWERQGVEVLVGDLADAASLSKALTGVDGAFIMQPTPFGVTADFPVAKAINASVVAALGDTPPPRLVILSSVGSEKASGIGNITQTHLLEEALAGFDLPIATVRAGSLLENYLAAVDRSSASGFFDSFLQPIDRAVPMTATRDIGEEVARLLVDGWQGHRIVELGTYTSPDEIAAAMGEVTGSPVQARAIPREHWEEALVGMGLASNEVPCWAEMQDGFNSGWIDFGVHGTVSVAGITTPAEVFSQARTAPDAK